jgi:holo-[acyl-carrier protein] synthase
MERINPSSSAEYPPIVQSMVNGIGIDIVEIARFEKNIFNSMSLRKKLFTANESSLNLHSLAARFAAKEALHKSIGTDYKFNWLEVEILNDVNGKPYFRFFGPLEEKLKSKNVLLSLSHENLFATAFVLIQT